MQWYYGPEGDQRIWYEPDEIEVIAEDELRSAGLMPLPDDPVTDLERLIEGHLKAQLDQYARLPEGVLGITQFGARRPVISISSALTEAAEEDPRAQGRSVGGARHSPMKPATSSCTATCSTPT